MYCYLVTYSFTDEKVVHGPYDSFDIAYEKMLAEAQVEYKIDETERNVPSKICIDKENGTITLATNMGDETYWEVIAMEV